MDSKDRKTPKKSWMIWGMAIAGIAIVFLVQSWFISRQTEIIPYSEFERLISAKQVSEVVIGADTIEGGLKSPLPSGKAQFSTIRVDPAIADKLEANGVKVTGTPSGGLLATIFSWVLPLVGFYFLWSFLSHDMTGKQGFGGLMSIGKSRAKVYVETDTHPH